MYSNSGVKPSIKTMGWHSEPSFYRYVYVFYSNWGCYRLNYKSPESLFGKKVDNNYRLYFEKNSSEILSDRLLFFCANKTQYFLPCFTYNSWHEGTSLLKPLFCGMKTVRVIFSSIDTSLAVDIFSCHRRFDVSDKCSAGIGTRPIAWYTNTTARRGIYYERGRSARHTNATDWTNFWNDPNRKH